MERYCCVDKCFIAPEYQSPGIACRKCKSYSFCRCQCKKWEVPDQSDERIDMWTLLYLYKDGNLQSIISIPDEGEGFEDDTLHNIKEYDQVKLVRITPEELDVEEGGGDYWRTPFKVYYGMKLQSFIARTMKEENMDK